MSSPPQPPSTPPPSTPPQSTPNQPPPSTPPSSSSSSDEEFQSPEFDIWISNIFPSSFIIPSSPPTSSNDHFHFPDLNILVSSLFPSVLPPPFIIPSVDTIDVFQPLIYHLPDIFTDNISYEQGLELMERLPPVSRGANPEIIDALPQTLYTNEFKETECSICLEKYERDEVIITLPCMHNFHKTCATQWLQINKICPICRHEL